MFFRIFKLIFLHNFSIVPQTIAKKFKIIFFRIFEYYFYKKLKSHKNQLFYVFQNIWIFQKFFRPFWKRHYSRWLTLLYMKDGLLAVRTIWDITLFGTGDVLCINENTAMSDDSALTCATFRHWIIHWYTNQDWLITCTSERIRRRYDTRWKALNASFPTSVVSSCNSFIEVSYGPIFGGVLNFRKWNVGTPERRNAESSAFQRSGHKLDSLTYVLCAKDDGLWFVLSIWGITLCATGDVLCTIQKTTMSVDSVTYVLCAKDDGLWFVLSIWGITLCGTGNALCAILKLDPSGYNLSRVHCVRRTMDSSSYPLYEASHCVAPVIIILIF